VELLLRSVTRTMHRVALFGVTKTFFVTVQPPRTRQVTCDPARNVKIFDVAIRALRRTVIGFKVVIGVDV
jgi:hypothetical protein